MLMATAFFWGSNFVVGKYLVGLAGPFTIAVLRFGLAAICLSVLLVIKEGWPRKLTLQKVTLLCILGLVGSFLANGLVFPALKYSTAINGSLIMALMPATTSFIACIVLKEQLKLINVLSLAISFLGAVLVLLSGQSLQNFFLNIGDLLFILAMLCGAINYVLVKVALKYFSILFITASSLFFGSIIMLPFALREISLGQTLQLSFYSWLLILYMAIFTTSVGFYFWNSGIKEVGPARASIFFNLVPVFTLILSAIFLTEKITFLHLFGLTLIIGGIACNQYFIAKPIN